MFYLKLRRYCNFGSNILDVVPAQEVNNNSKNFDRLGKTNYPNIVRSLPVPIDPIQSVRKFLGGALTASTLTPSIDTTPRLLATSFCPKQADKTWLPFSLFVSQLTTQTASSGRSRLRVVILRTRKERKRERECVCVCVCVCV